MLNSLILPILILKLQHIFVENDLLLIAFELFPFSLLFKLFFYLAQLFLVSISIFAVQFFFLARNFKSHCGTLWISKGAVLLHFFFVLRKLFLRNLNLNLYLGSTSSHSLSRWRNHNRSLFLFNHWCCFSDFQKWSSSWRSNSLFDRFLRKKFFLESSCRRCNSLFDRSRLVYLKKINLWNLFYLTTVSRIQGKVLLLFLCPRIH